MSYREVSVYFSDMYYYIVILFYYLKHTYFHAALYYYIFIIDIDTTVIVNSFPPSMILLPRPYCEFLLYALILSGYDTTQKRQLIHLGYLDWSKRVQLTI